MHATNTSKRSMIYKRVFLDSNVLIDLLLSRKPFQLEARSVFELGIAGEVELFTSSLSFMNTHYIVSKTFGQKRALAVMSEARKLLSLLSVNENIVDAAIQNSGTDFEDAVQYYSAKAGQCDVIVSRDKSGFKDFDIPCKSPKEFIEIWKVK